MIARLLEWNVEFDCLIIIELHVGCFESPYRVILYNHASFCDACKVDCVD